MNPQSSDFGWINEIDKLLEHTSPTKLDSNKSQNDKDVGGLGKQIGIKRSKSNEVDNDDDEDDDTDYSDDDEINYTHGSSNENNLSTHPSSKGSKGTKEKSKEQREKRKVFCAKLINQARQLSESALNEADKKEEMFKELKEKKQYYFNITLEVLRNICAKNFEKSINKSIWESLLDDTFEIVYPRNSYFFFKEDIKNDSIKTNKTLDAVSEDCTRIKITTIDALVKIIHCVDFFLASLARLGTNLLDKVIFQPRLTDFILNGNCASANVTYTSINAFLCGGYKEVSIQGNLIIKFAENKRISSLELFYNKNECDLVFMESFGWVIEKIPFSDNINNISNIEKPDVFMSTSGLDIDNTSFQLIYGNKSSEDAFKEIVELNILQKQHLLEICGHDVDKSISECKPQYFVMKNSNSKNPLNDVLLQAIPYYSNSNNENTKMSISRIFELILSRNFVPNKIVWTLYKSKVYDNIMTRLVFLCTNNIVSMYSSWLDNIGNFIASCFQSKVNSRYHMLQEVFQMLRSALDQMEMNAGGNTYVNVQNFLIIISKIDFLITSEVREDEYQIEDDSNIEQIQNMDVLISEEQQLIRSVSNEVDKFFSQIRITKLLEQIVKLLSVVENEHDSNSLQNFINLCWTRHSNAAIQGLQESLRAYVLQKNALETKVCISEIISIDPNYAEAYSKRAAINFSMNDSTSAMIDIERAVSIDPYHYGAWCTKGIMEMKLSLFEAAIKSFTTAIDINPSLQSKSIKVYLDQCVLKLQQQQNQEMTI